MAKYLLLLAFIGCGGAPANSTGPTDGSTSHPGNTPGNTPPGGSTLDGAVVQAQGVTCNPTDSLCMGTKLFTCTLSGTDAAYNYDCASNTTASNPGVCSTAIQCAYGNKACCTKAKPVCTWNLTAPFSETGTFNYNQAGTTLCSIYGSSCAGQTNFSIYWSNAMQSCPLTQRSIVISASNYTVGAAIALPAANNNVSLNVNDTESGTATTCYAWTGTITITADMPSPSVTINATCSETGKTSFHITGTISGNY